MKPSPLAFLIFNLLFAAAGEAAAADWWFVPAGQTSAGDAMVYVDKASMRRTRGTGIVNASVWIFHRREQTSEFGSYRSERSRMTLNCESREAGSDSGSLLSAFGGVIHRYKLEAPALAPIAPESPGESLATFMCSDGKQPPRSLPVFDPGRDVEQRFLQLDRERGVRAVPAP